MRSNSRDVLNSREVFSAGAWSMLTQVASKLVTPISTIILARILTPEAYGIVAVATMFVSLTNIFTDAGFQKYIIQANFENKTQEARNTSVAFWSNTIISSTCWLLITIFQQQIANSIGISGQGLLLSVTALTLPINAITSVPLALLQKKFRFKKIFVLQTISAITIPATSIPLAICGYSYWSLTLSTVASRVVLLLLTILFASWRPILYFSVQELKSMFSFGIWILIESVTLWLNANAGTFIINHLLSKKYVGYYNTSTSLANSITSFIIASIMPVAFSTFSMVKSDVHKLDASFLRFQKYLAIMILPITAGCFVYHDLVTDILLGHQWRETSLFFGLWMFANCFSIVFGNLCSELYRAIGKPKVSAYAQIVYLIPLILSLVIGAKGGYALLSILVPISRLTLPVIHLILFHIYTDITLSNTLTNVRSVFLAVLIACIPALPVYFFNLNVIETLFLATVSLSVYIVFMCFGKSTRDEVHSIAMMLIKKKAM